MSEKGIGVKQQELVSFTKTKQGSLTITHSSGDIVSNTIGHLAAIPLFHLPYWTPDAIAKNPTIELAKKLQARWKDVPWKGDVLARIGNTSLVGDIQRILQNEHIGGPFSFQTKDSAIKKTLAFLYKVLAIPASVLISAQAKFLRIDHYNVFTNTVNVFHPRLAVGMHELGHAEFYNKEPKRTLYALAGHLPIIHSFKEWKASSLAMPKFLNDAERRDAVKLLEPAFAGYLTKDVFWLAFPFSPVLASLMGKGGIPLAAIGGTYMGHTV